MRKSYGLLLGMMAGVLFLSGTGALADSAFLLQLGSFPSEQAAQDKWAALQKDHADVLGALPNRIASVPVGNNTTIYRLQAGPINDRAKAGNACSALKEDKLDCYLVETATLSTATPKQALTGVHASDTDELQLGKVANEETGLVHLDTAMPRMTEMNPPPARAVSQKTEVAEEPKPAPSIAFADASPDMPAVPETSAAPDIEPVIAAPSAPEPAPKETFTKLEKPNPVARAQQPSYRLHSSGGRGAAEALGAPAKSPAAEPSDKEFIASASAPTMGSLGTLKVASDGQVLGASAPAPKQAAPEPARFASQMGAPTGMNAAPAPSPSVTRFGQPRSIALLAPPPLRLDRPVPTAYVPVAPAIASQAPSMDPNARVEVREAIPVDTSTIVPHGGAENTRAPAPAAAPASMPYAPPTPWRGSPSAPAALGTQWAQFGQFNNEGAAFAFFDALRAENPERFRGVRVRALQPYMSRGLGSHIALRVGPYRSPEEVSAVCEPIRQRRQPCTSIRENGVPSDSIGATRDANWSTSADIAQSFGVGSGPNAPRAGTFWVQLGTYRTEAEAYNRYSSLISGSPALFKGMRPNVAQPKNAGKGSAAAVRLRVGPFAEQSTALGFCNGLAHAGTGCVIVKE